MPRIVVPWGVAMVSAKGAPSVFAASQAIYFIVHLDWHHLIHVFYSLMAYPLPGAHAHSPFAGKGLSWEQEMLRILHPASLPSISYSGSSLWARKARSHALGRLFITVPSTRGKEAVSRVPISDCPDGGIRSIALGHRVRWNIMVPGTCCRGCLLHESWKAKS